jgi:alpha-N-acetylgalactosaminidase
MCNIDCDNYPDACINEQLYKTQAELMISEGYVAVGYKQINIDDCWSTLERDPVTDEQVADPARFPSGIKTLSKWMHDRDLLIGLYSDIGSKTCGGYIGMQDHLELDANTFASWDIDMLKVDGCYQDPSIMEGTYTELSNALNATGRDIVYSCSWPAYLEDNGEANDGEVLYKLQNICNLWRNFDDIEDSWSSVSSIVNKWKRDDPNDPFVKVAQPGAWNDPDMLMIGNNGLSIYEERSQMALWAIFAAPLLMSNDLARVSPESKAILQNVEIIAVDQDPLGQQGYLVSTVDGQYGNDLYRVWARPMDDGSFAIVLQNAFAMEAYQKITFTPDMIGWDADTQFTARDLFEHKDLGVFSEITMNVNPSDVQMLRIYKA